MSAGGWPPVPPELTAATGLTTWPDRGSEHAHLAEMTWTHARRRVEMRYEAQDGLWLVAEYDGVLVGTTALHIYGSNLAEIRSLVVRPDHQHKQIGRLMIEAAEKWAAGLGVARIFALTYVPGFFARLGAAGSSGVAGAADGNAAWASLFGITSPLYTHTLIPMTP